MATLGVFSDGGYRNAPIQAMSSGRWVGPCPVWMRASGGTWMGMLRTRTPSSKSHKAYFQAVPGQAMVADKELVS